MDAEQIKRNVTRDARLVHVCAPGVDSQIVDVRDADGNPLPYDGYSRRAALKSVLGREIVAGEEIGTTFLFIPATCIKA